MTAGLPPGRPTAVAAAVEEAYRQCWAEVLAATLRVTREFDLAEDCVQDAFSSALVAWGAGPPRNPAAWLTTTARRRAIDQRRREATARQKLPLLLLEDPDDRRPGTDLLRLVFTCCHPALSPDAQLALTLRLVGGLTVPEIACGLLVKEATVAARITRAKGKIAAAGVPFRVPADAELPARSRAALEVIHLIHTPGHTAPAGPVLTRSDLTAKARDLARMLDRLLPGDADVVGLLALCLLDDARVAARTGADGRLVPLPDQDRSQWDPALLAEGLTCATRALGLGPSRYALQAGIAGMHAAAPSWAATDWAGIVALYDRLLAQWPSPVVALNRLAALSLRPGADLSAVLAGLDRLAGDPALSAYAYLPAARADVLRRLGRPTEAAAAYDAAIRLSRNDPEIAYLRARRAEGGR